MDNTTTRERVGAVDALQFNHEALAESRWLPVTAVTPAPELNDLEREQARAGQQELC